MKSLLFSIFAVVTLSFSIAGEAEDVARELLEVTGSSEMGKQMMTQMVTAMKPSMPQVPQEFWDKFLEEANASDLVELVIPIYVKHLSVEDMKAAIAFYQSPAGKNFVAKQPVITQESFEVGQQWGLKLGTKIATEVQEKYGQ